MMLIKEIFRKISEKLANEISGKLQSKCYVVKICLVNCLIMLRQIKTFVL